MRIAIIIITVAIVCTVDVSSSETVANNELFSFSMRDVYLCFFFFLGSIISFGLGGAHEWHLTLQDIRIDEGKIINVQRHQLLAGFKERAVVWSGIIGAFIAIMATQIEHLSEKLSFQSIMSGFLVLIGPYLLGRLIYIFYLHGSEYRKKKTTASRNFLPFYFMNISILVLIVCLWSISEFIYFLIGNEGQSTAYIYISLTVRSLVALVVPCFIDQTVLTINFIKKIDSKPAQFAFVCNELARMLGYWETVEANAALGQSIDAIKIEKDGLIHLDENTDINLLLSADKRTLCQND